MNIVYTDASYNWKTTVDGKGTGRICILINDQDPIIEEVTLEFKGLKQLINRFEFYAIQRGLELGGECILYSDSETAVKWSKNPNVRWVRRDKNLAGLVFEGYSRPKLAIELRELKKTELYNKAAQSSFQSFINFSKRKTKKGRKRGLRYKHQK